MLRRRRTYSSEEPRRQLSRIRSLLSVSSAVAPAELSSPLSLLQQVPMWSSCFHLPSPAGHSLPSSPNGHFKTVTEVISFYSKPPQRLLILPTVNSEVLLWDPARSSSHLPLWLYVLPLSYVTPATLASLYLEHTKQAPFPRHAQSWCPRPGTLFLEVYARITPLLHTDICCHWEAFPDHLK